MGYIQEPITEYIQTHKSCIRHNANSISFSLLSLCPAPTCGFFHYLRSFSLTFFTSLYLLPLLSQISITIFTFSNPFLSFLVYSFFGHSPKLDLLILNRPSKDMNLSKENSNRKAFSNLIVTSRCQSTHSSSSLSHSSQITSSVPSNSTQC